VKTISPIPGAVARFAGATGQFVESRIYEVFLDFPRNQIGLE
jgi:hypothetical protein